MTTLKRLPVYATGVGFAVALAIVADSRGWSGFATLGAGLLAAAFYVVLILVPYLIREQQAERRSGLVSAERPFVSDRRPALAMASHHVQRLPAPDVLTIHGQVRSLDAQTPPSLSRLLDEAEGADLVNTISPVKVLLGLTDSASESDVTDHRTGAPLARIELFLAAGSAWKTERRSTDDLAFAGPSFD